MSRSESSPDSYDDVPLSALLPAARSVYSHAITAALSQIGCDDLPGTGSYIISAMHWSGASLEAVIRWMGVSKQAVSKTVDTLVLRGYLERVRDPSDRRKVNLTLTSRGREAGKAARSAVEKLDRALRGRVGAQQVATVRTVLVTLLELDRHERRPGGLRPPSS